MEFPAARKTWNARISQGARPMPPETDMGDFSKSDQARGTSFLYSNGIGKLNQGVVQSVVQIGDQILPGACHTCIRQPKAVPF